MQNEETAGQLLTAYSSGTQLVNIYNKITGICESVDMPYVTVDSEIEEGYVNDTGVFVNTKGNVDFETVLQVFRIIKDEEPETLADGNELARDSVEMYSKSGFFDKIGGFFRSLFGSTKIYSK